MKIVVIGAGPAGSYVSYLLSKSGHDVELYEEHNEIGVPIQCTGLLSSEFKKFEIFHDLPSNISNVFIVNKFNEIVLNSPGVKVELSQEEFLVNRAKFDSYLANLALEAGTKIFISHHFIKKSVNDKKEESLLIKDKNNNEIKKVGYDIVIGADGPLSSVAKEFSFNTKHRKYYHGVQAVIKGNFNPNCYYTYFGNNVCPDFFGWVVPESKTHARVGIASKNNVKKYFNNFIEKYCRDFNFEFEGESIKFQSAIIPIYSSKQKFQKGKCYLIGDSAAQVKATTLGGIIPSFKAAHILVDSINNNFCYNKQLRKLRRGLKVHLLARNIFDKINDNDLNKLFYLVKQDKVQKVLKKYSRDNPVPLFVNLILKEPRFVLFAKYLFN
ncbi:NAD(P)/FAD-dependent oxidoreductase [archaeon]|jgi:digeranylgeranylglycerophospholipid reductase|nr:NAD(P)/FAD-dependent oxidoreductase [archaeon]MBT3450889.1 NAD(P)/FAD-dependent oxidoreductase [archaeon]MBT6869071.1 NAD(P)/FAD-dependent oxidoreductase [archaeon]MBT7193314.1 NAD(P)/FAD-dependent oxidoreductase [archaeon]MBT7380322.1 NAD(P)/FAD-dependent oxidoreductase [archaeon]